MIRFSEDEDGDYVYSSKLLNIEYDWINEDEVLSFENMKKLCENMIEEHYEDKISYYEEILRLFKEG